MCWKYVKQICSEASRRMYFQSTNRPQFPHKVHSQCSPDRVKLSHCSLSTNRTLCAQTVGGTLHRESTLFSFPKAENVEQKLIYFGFSWRKQHNNITSQMDVFTTCTRFSTLFILSTVIFQIWSQLISKIVILNDIWVFRIVYHPKPFQ